MKAAVLYSPNSRVVIEDIDIVPPKAGEVLVAISAAGICRSDLHFIKGEGIIPLPSVLGHEGAGIVEEVGTGVTRLSPGDHVILSFVPNCGRCYSCSTGNPNLCDTHGATPGTMFDGTTRLRKGTMDIYHQGKVACFAEKAVVPESGCIPVPKSVPLEHAALIGCSVTTGIGATLLNAQVQPDSTVAIIGCGGVGLNIIQGSSLIKSSTIIAVDIDDEKLAFSKHFGATHVVNALSEDPINQILRLTNGQGVDYAFESYGSSHTVEVACAVVRKRGTVVVVGIAPIGIPAKIDLASLVRQEKILKGCYYGSARCHIDMPKMINMYLAGNINIEGLITKRYKLEQINEAYKELDEGKIIGRGILQID